MAGTSQVAGAAWRTAESGPKSHRPSHSVQRKPNLQGSRKFYEGWEGDAGMRNTWVPGVSEAPHLRILRKKPGSHHLSWLCPTAQGASPPDELWPKGSVGKRLPETITKNGCACSSCKCLAFPEFEGPGHQTAAEAEPWDPNPNYFIWFHTEIKNKKQTLINFVIIEWNHFMSVASNIYMDLNFKSF